MGYKDYATLSKKIHKSLLEEKDMQGELAEIDAMLDDMSRKIGPGDEATWHELERRRNIQ